MFSSVSVVQGSPLARHRLVSALSPVMAEFDFQERQPSTLQRRAMLSSTAGRGGGRGGEGRGGRGGEGRGDRGFEQQQGGRGGGGAGRGAGGRWSGGRGAGMFQRFRERRAAEAMSRGKNKKPKKPNFAREVLDPAARGELQKGHRSGIPRLAGRKGKGHAIHDVLSADEAKHLRDIVAEEQDLARDQEEEEQVVGYSSGGAPTSLPPRRGVRVQYNAPTKKTPPPRQEDEYDSEEEYDELEVPSLAAFERHPDVTKNENGTYTIEFDEDDWGFYDSDEELDETESSQQQEPYMGRRERDLVKDGPRPPRDLDPEEAFFVKDLTDLSDPFPEVPDEVANQVAPLADHGENLDDFLQAMYEHPTKYAEVKRYNLHPESLREAQPEFPDDRKNAEPAFVNNYKRFLYISGLPHVVVDEKPGDFENPLHRQDVTKTVVSLLNVKPEQVSPANMTSAFVGYHVIKERNKTLRTGPTQKVLGAPIVISKLDESEAKELDRDFVKDPDTVVKLSNLQTTTTDEFLARNLFPSDTELGSVYGPLSTDRILATSPTTALIRFESAQQAESALESSMVKDQLQKIGQCRVRLFKAKRELVPSGFTGPANGHEMFKRGNRLIVDGDVPSKDFYISHFEALELSGLDETITKKDIADWVQPFCAEARDVEGSVEYATCVEGLKTGRAFVGFDFMGEGQTVLEALGDKTMIGNCTVRLRALHDKPQRRGEKREVRPHRSEEELLDSLNNWEKFVDPEDIKYLEQHGVAKHVLDDAFMTMRYKNKTFGPTDWAMHREKLDPERERGDIYKEAVREYIRILKECMATPEDPGLMFKGLFMQNEELDLSIFDREKERQKKLKAKRDEIL